VFSAETAVAILIAFIVGAAVLAITGYSPLDAYVSMASGAFGSSYGVGQTLTQATPIVFTSIAFLIGLKAGLFNIGIEGQFLMGAMGATLAGIYLDGLPWVIHVPMTIMVGMIAGAFWALILLSYVATHFTSYLVNYPFKAPGWVAQSVKISGSAELPRILPPTQLSAAIFVAVMITAASTYFLQKTIIGYELRATGLNPSAAENAGISIDRSILVSMALSGAVAGLGGACEIMGIHRRFIQGFSPGYGWDGLAVALVGGLNPVGSFFASVLFGALRNGGMIMTRATGVPLDIVNILQALVIMFVAAPKLIRALLRREQ